MKAKKPISGAQKLRASGRKAIMITVTPQEKLLLKWAAEVEDRCVSQFVQHHALDYARLLQALSNQKRQLRK